MPTPTHVSETPFYDAEKEALVTSTSLINLRRLDLSGQNIDDNFLQKLSNNETFKRIEHINLSRNPLITMEGIKALLESDYLGSVRDWMQIHGKYGLACVEISVNTEGTYIYKSAEKFSTASKGYFTVERFDFSISYQHPVTGEEVDRPRDDGMKILKVTMDYPG